MRRSLLQRYETRRRRNLHRPIDQRTFRGRFLDAGSWENWLRTCSLFAWVAAARLDAARGVRIRHPARIFEIKQYLNFPSPGEKNVDHYQSECRLGLLAYAFRKSERLDASELRELPGAACDSSFAAFVSGNPRAALYPPKKQWGVSHSFLRAQRGSAQARGTGRGKADIRKSEPPIP